LSALIQSAEHQRKNCQKLSVFATAQDAGKRQRAPPGVDTRIHWENEDEGWIGASNSKPTEEQLKSEAQQKNLLGDKFAELLNSSDSHYQ